MWLRRSPPLLPAAGLLLVVAAIALGLVPPPVRHFLRKEGPSEWLQEGLLAVAAALWAVAALRHRSPVALAATLFLLLLLAEETDWGGRDASLHNAWGGRLYPLFILPPLALFVAGAVGVKRARTLPLRSEALALFALAVPAAAAIAVPAWEGELDELFEVVLYALLGWVGGRVARATATASPPPSP